MPNMSFALKKKSQSSKLNTGLVFEQKKILFKMFTSFWSTETFIKKLYFFCFKFFRCKGKKIKIWQKKKKRLENFMQFSYIKKKLAKGNFFVLHQHFLFCEE